MAASFTGLGVEEELARLLRLNYDLVEALKGKKPKDKRLAHGEGLALKLFSHASTALHLAKGTNPKLRTFDFEINFIDWASIQVLARAATETVLAFDYVFRGPVNEDDAEFRYLSWMLGGFTRRESFTVDTPAARDQQDKDIKQNERMRKRIQKTVAFKALTSRQQRDVLEGRNWHPQRTLSAMCEDVFGETLGRDLYSFMSSHAHADALSSVQVQQTHGNAQELSKAPLLVIALALARMCESYSSKWVRARRVYSIHQYRQLNEAYLSFREFESKAEDSE